MTSWEHNRRYLLHRLIQFRAILEIINFDLFVSGRHRFRLFLEFVRKYVHSFSNNAARVQLVYLRSMKRINISYNVQEIEESQAYY